MNDLEPGLILKILEFGWVVLTAPIFFIWGQIEKIKKDQEKIKESYFETSLHAANTYVKQADYRQDLMNIHNDIKTIDKKLDHMTELINRKKDRE